MKIVNKACLFLLVTIFLLSSSLAYASTTLGTVDNAYKYAWSNQIGWINFAPTDDTSSYVGATITDSAITGYAWSENLGWINLNPTQGGVLNSSSGTLSGSAWGENTGWIDFSGVTINSSGEFTGTATGDVVGTLNFNCSNCTVTTDWRPTSTSSGGGVSSNNGLVTTTSKVTFSGKAYPGATILLLEGETILKTSLANNGSDFIIDTNVANGDYVFSIYAKDKDGNQSKSLLFPVNGVFYADTEITNILIPPTISSNIDSNNDQSTINIHGQSIENSQVKITVKAPDENFVFFANSDSLGEYKYSFSNYQLNDGSYDAFSQVQFFDSLAESSPVSFVVGNENTQENNNNLPLYESILETLLTDEQLQQLTNLQAFKNVNGDQNAGLSQSGGISNIGGGTSSDNKFYQDIDNNNLNQSIKSVFYLTGDSVVDILSQPAILFQKYTGVVGERIHAVINTVPGSLITKTVSTTGIAATTGTFVFTGFFSLSSQSDIIFIFIRLWGILLNLLGIKKKSKRWGIVYDSITKQPIDPAQVVLLDKKGDMVSQAITDIDGRYGFLVAPGAYKMIANKTNYKFPSKNLFGKSQDELYNSLYFGEDVEVTKTGEVITKNIPLDPIGFDWNEFAKKSSMKFYSKRERVIAKFTNFLFIIGFLVAILSYLFAPHPYNIIIFISYIFILILKITGLRLNSSGFVRNKITGLPLSFAILRIISALTNLEISHKVADEYGNYYCLVPRGKYIVKIEQKNQDGSYSLVYTSEIIDVSKRGIIKNNFFV